LVTNAKEFAVSSYDFENYVINGEVNNEEQEVQIKEKIDKNLTDLSAISWLHERTKLSFGKS